MTKLLAVSALLLAACGGGASGDDDDDTVPPDVAPETICGDLAPGGNHLIFLSFEGEDLTSGNDDAVTNQWSALASASTVPAWQGVGDRATAIEAITCDVRRALDAFDVAVVTTRPDAGPYQMLVLGGEGSAIGIPDELLALTTSTDCGNARDNDLGWVHGGLSDLETADLVLGAIGTMSGLDGSFPDATDCVCGWGGTWPQCTADYTSVCSFGVNSSSDAPGDFVCSTTGMQDEVALLTAAYGAR